MATAKEPIPKIGAIEAGWELHLIPAQNGGWIIRGRGVPGAEGELLGAYSEAADMIGALEFALVETES